jgi:hypothetical protein
MPSLYKALGLIPRTKQTNITKKVCESASMPLKHPAGIRMDNSVFQGLETLEKLSRRVVTSQDLRKGDYLNSNYLICYPSYL